MSKIYEALKLAEVEREMAPPQPKLEAEFAPAIDREPALAPEPVISVRWPTRRVASREEMLSLYVKVEVLLGDSDSRAVAVMSARSGEGATSIAREFALAVAELSDRQVLLVDANPNDNGLHRQLSLPERTGLEDVVRRKLPIETAIYQLAPRNLHLARLSLQKTGSGQILDSASLDGLFGRLRERFNEIVIDAPPAVSSGAGMTLARRSDGVVLVLAAEQTRAPVVEQAKKVIEANDSRLLGVVMNRRRHHIPNLIYRWL